MLGMVLGEGRYFGNVENATLQQPRDVGNPRTSFFYSTYLSVLTMTGTMMMPMQKLDFMRIYFRAML